MQQKTSEVIQKSHTTGPNVQGPMISWCRLMGKTMIATSRSARASETMRPLVRVLMSRKRNTDNITKTFPTIMTRMKAASTMARQISNVVTVMTYGSMTSVTFSPTSPNRSSGPADRLSSREKLLLLLLYRDSFCRKSYMLILGGSTRRGQGRCLGVPPRRMMPPWVRLLICKSSYDYQQR